MRPTMKMHSNVARCNINQLSITHHSFSFRQVCQYLLNSVALDGLQSIFHLKLVKNLIHLRFFRGSVFHKLKLSQGDFKIPLSTYL